MKRIVETELANMWLEDDILFFIWKEGISIDLSGAKKTVARRMALQQGKSYRILCNINGVRHIEKEAWHFLSGEGAELVQELVLVAATPLERVFFKYILSLGIFGSHAMSGTLAFCDPSSLFGRRGNFSRFGKKR